MEDITMEVDEITNIIKTEDNGTYIPEETSREEIELNAQDKDCNLQYVPPILFKSEILIELSNLFWKSPVKTKEDIQPYLRGCKWSPDGTCCLTVVNKDGIHVNELPKDLYTETPSRRRNVDILDSVIHNQEAGLVYDFCWYPSMHSAYPETCCWITTRQHSPIQMWDAYDGSLRCSYRGFNSVDEIEPAISCTFTPDGSRIIAGYKKYLRTFDVNRPGRDYNEHRIPYSASCLTMDSNLLAVGTWNTAICLYNVNELGTYKTIGKMHGHTGGVTHMKFLSDGLKLVTGGRKDNKLLIWDIRYYRKPLNTLTRVVNTNQRIYFDISPCGRYLATGGTDGIVKVWDSDQVDWKSAIDVTDCSKDNVTYKFPLHNDCCNSVSIHPLRPILATGSGQYHFEDPILALEDDIKCEQTDCNYGRNHLESKKTDSLELVDRRYSKESENSLVFWWIGESSEESASGENTNT